jgi:hypothetical protein
VSIGLFWSHPTGIASADPGKVCAAILENRIFSKIYIIKMRAADAFPVG